MAGRGRGQPTKLTPDAIERFLTGRRLGVPKKDCAALAGWSEALRCHFLAVGADARDRLEEGGTLTAKDRRCLDFLDADEKAEAQFKQAALARIVAAAQQPRHWTAAAWLLERRHPDEFGVRRVEVTGPNGGPIQVDVRASELLDRLRALTAGEPASNGHGVLDDPNVIDVEEA